MAKKVRDRWTDAVWMVASVAVTTSLVFYWHAVNRAYPALDCAEFALVSLKTYWTFMTEGILSGLHTFYTLRTWRAISYPEVLVPGFFLSGGRVLLALAITSVILYALLTWIGYKLARIYLRPVESFLVVSVLLNIPWIRSYEHLCVYELPMFVFFSGSWLAAFHSDYFKKKGFTILSAVLAGLAISVSPGESVFFLSMTSSAYILSGLKRKMIPIRDVKGAILLTVIFSIPIFAAVLTSGKFDMGAPGNILWAPEPDLLKFWMTLLGVAAAGVVYLTSVRKTSETWLPLYAVVGGLVVVLWLGPYFWQLGQWLRIASYHPKVPFYDFPMMLKQRLGLLAFTQSFKENFVGLGSLLLFVATAIEIWKSPGKKPLKENAPAPKGVFFAVFVLFVVQSLMAAESFNPNLRYLTMGLISLYFFAFVILCQTTYSPWLKRGLLTCCLIVLMLNQLNSYGAIDNKWSNKIPSLFGQGNVLPPVREEDYSVRFLKFITDNIDVNLPVLIYPTGDPYTLWAGPQATTLISIEKGFAVWGSWMQGDWKESTRQDGSTAYGYYVVGPLEFAKPELLAEVRKDAHVWLRPIKFTPPQGPPATFFLIKL